MKLGENIGNRNIAEEIFWALSAATKEPTMFSWYTCPYAHAVCYNYKDTHTCTQAHTHTQGSTLHFNDFGFGDRQMESEPHFCLWLWGPSELFKLWMWVPPWGLWRPEDLWWPGAAKPERLAGQRHSTSSSNRRVCWGGKIFKSFVHKDLSPNY